MDYLDNLVKQKKPTAYNWQQRALDLWDKLHVSGRPPATYFRCFKRNQKKAESVIQSMSDGTFKDPLNTFFWKYGND